MSALKTVRRTLLGWSRFLRSWRAILKGFLSTRHVLLVHIIPIRRCNLSCAYCNEYDDFSKPVPTAEMKRRIDLLAAMGTSVITISGGEPLLHPELEEIIRHIRGHGIIAGMITNGYLLTAERIQRLNRARLDFLQISIDNVVPDEVSKKSLKVLDQKLVLLAEHADFQVNINSVVGSGVHAPEDALIIAHRAHGLGFTSTVGVIHDDNGRAKEMGERERRIFEEIKNLRKRNYARVDWFQKKLTQGQPNEWRCRAGSRYLYICEDGLVHHCSQQRGYPAIPLEEYTPEMRRREYFSQKHCAPLCTISCVQQVATIDNWRHPQRWMAPLPARPPAPASLVQVQAKPTLSEQTDIAPAD
jgi:MoaA/NifB/PqqE/SkfB family radical SAM enzyme